MTKIIARATNDRGQVVELKGVTHPEELWIDGVKKIERAANSVKMEVLIDEFYFACRVEEDSHE